MSEDFDAPDDGSVTWVITYQVRPDRRDDFEDWIAGITDEVARFPGREGVTVLRPVTVLLHGTAMAQTPSLRLGSALAKGPVLRHNPIFGLGPQTIWKGGIGVALEGELSRAAGALETRDRALHAELLYGVTQDLTLTLALPLTQRKSVRGLVPGVGQVDRDATGIGDAVIRAKWFAHLRERPRDTEFGGRTAVTRSTPRHGVAVRGHRRPPG